MTGLHRYPPARPARAGCRPGARLAILGSLLGLLAALAWAQPAAAASDLRDEIECLALNIYFEARGEPDQGKLAVGYVVLNRVADQRFPQSVCDVVRQGGEKRLLRCQFTWWCDGRSDRPEDQDAWRQSKKLARSVFWGFSSDPTAGALWYHATHVKPAWRRQLARVLKIGRHLFYCTKPAKRIQTADAS